VRRALLAALLLATSCGSGHADVRNPDAGVTRTTGEAPPPLDDPSRPAVIVTPGEDVPNPFVVVEDGRYLLFASQKGIFEHNLPVRGGPSLDRLGEPEDAFPDLPDWVQRGFTWAPDVRRVGDRWVMWFTAANKRGRTDGVRFTQCIGVAVSDDPEGPYEALGDGPRICQLDRWGSIDPRTFVDEDGQLWLHWKSDDNAEVGADTKASIYAQRLADDGITLQGRRTRILEADQPWEGRIVEAPQMVLVDGRHWLFYSGNWFNQPVYGIGIAECDGPAGPCRKPLDRPWLGSNAQGSGPGEASLFQDRDGWWIVYGPWAVEYEEQTPRPTALARVGFGPLGPYLAELPA
jgi:GH43 family beta-xylosidase